MNNRKSHPHSAQKIEAQLKVINITAKSALMLLAKHL
jgi:hypothetical protein